MNNNTVTIYDPATGNSLRSYAYDTDQIVAEKLSIHNSSLASWQLLQPEQRSDYLYALADKLESGKERLAALMAQEMGKLIKGGIMEVEKCALGCRYYAEHGPAMLKDEPVKTEATYSGITYRPLGSILAIMPWNYPFWQVFRFTAPALMAGNGILLKHASNIPCCADAIGELCKDAGLPEGLLTVLHLPASRIESLIESDTVQAITLTGSTQAGKQVAAIAGKHLKKCVLELGGSDPYIVFADADMDLAVNACSTGRLVNTGQSCIGAKRFIIEKPVYDQFLEKLTSRFRTVKMGMPDDFDAEIGPLAKVTFRDELHNQVEESIKAGARCVTGGYIPDQPGAWYPSTILADVKPGMAAYHEELFGPVAAVICAEDESDAIRIANDTPFGLGAAVFTRDHHKALRITRDLLQAGSCFANTFVRSDPRLPFGGIKDSGYGRELGLMGIREFVNVKTIWLA
jgi:succinate-semialdehyde dehydrogenase / glutarate-semialdehyde dehydrogenase